MILNLLTEGLVFAGACILVSSLPLVRNLISQTSSKSLRHRWYTLAALIAFFIIGYLSYIMVFWNRPVTWFNLIVPVVFFLGAIFVWLTVTLSLQTIADVRRITLLERENITDPLIGIYNRRYLDRCLIEEYAYAQQNALPLSVLLIDVDHFKRVNDTYGHQVGDLVLKHLGKLLLQVLRSSDIAIRYGGEEILIVAPNTITSSAETLAERLRKHVEANKIKLTNELNETHEICITISVGVATLSEETSDCNKLVQNADEAVYHAKQEGRNCIFTHKCQHADGMP